MTDTPDDTTPAEAIEAAADALSTDPRLRGFSMTGWQRTVATIAVEAAVPLIAARAAAAQLERDIQLATDKGAQYPNPGADRGPLREVLRRPPFLPFADLLAAPDTP